MYHPINKINCPPLNKLNDLARLTLEFCLQQTLALPEEQIRERFVQHFTANSYPNAGDWLWGKDVLVREKVLFLIQCSAAPEKSEIFRVYLENQDIDGRFADGDFVYLTLPMPLTREVSYAYENTAELAGNFYKILGEGVPGEKINETELLNRQTVLRAYLDAQKSLSLKVCPGCDGKPPSVTDGVIHEDLDHFFPKSKYPFLAIHPQNLTPLCKDCNQTYKRSKDAILDDNPIVSDVQCLHDVYHPYLRAGENDLHVEIRDKNGKVGYQIECQTQAMPYLARLHSLQYVLNIESRWTGDLEEERVEEHLYSLLLHGSQPDRDRDFLPDIDWLNNQLTSALDTLHRQRGRIPNYVPAYIYTHWVNSNANVKDQWLERVKRTLAQSATPS